MKELIEYIAKNLVDDPAAVQVSERRRSRNNVDLKLQVAKSDMGRVIGKGGRVANAMRSLLRIAAIKRGQRVDLEIR
jgi:predicted RNA-binding protein YlqC (UPF0109 family)